MTAIYISPSSPAVATAAAAFSGQLEVTGPANAPIMQKAVYLARAARITAAWVSGVDGLDTVASGQTRIRLSDHPYDAQSGAAGIDLTLAASQSRGQATGDIAVLAGSWLYIFITQATGGHYGAQVGLEITWQE